MSLLVTNAADLAVETGDRVIEDGSGRTAPCSHRVRIGAYYRVRHSVHCHRLLRRYAADPRYGRHPLPRTPSAGSHSTPAGSTVRPLQVRGSGA